MKQLIRLVQISLLISLLTSCSRNTVEVDEPVISDSTSNQEITYPYILEDKEIENFLIEIKGTWIFCDKPRNNEDINYFSIYIDNNHYQKFNSSYSPNLSEAYYDFELVFPYLRDSEIFEVTEVHQESENQYSLILKGFILADWTRITTNEVLVTKIGDDSIEILLKLNEEAESYLNNLEEQSRNEASYYSYHFYNNNFIMTKISDEIDFSGLYYDEWLQSN